MKNDLFYMQRATVLAENGRGFVNPNPLVGAVVVKDGRVIGEGWHEYFGGWHAERNALKNCTEDPEGATLYVTLEPCCHYGKTPPCTTAIIEHKIAKVIVGLKDPNPLVAGKGIETLRAAGIAVESGVNTVQGAEQNRIFLKYIATGLPWVVMKTAMTLDGKIATATGDAKWVSGEAAREQVQRMRAEYMGIMAGSNTVRQDDPLLNYRGREKGRQPIRIIADSKAGLSLECRILQTAKEFRTIIAHTASACPRKLEKITQCGAETMLCNDKEERIDLGDMLKKIGQQGIDSILLEGGGTLNESFLRHGFVDEVFAFISPKYVGGREAKTPVEGEGVARMSEAVGLAGVEVSRIGEDILIHGMLNKERHVYGNY